MTACIAYIIVMYVNSMIASSLRCSCITVNTASSTRPRPSTSATAYASRARSSCEKELRDLPRLECFDLLLGEAERTAGLAVLREHELAADDPSRARLAQ